MMHKYLIIGLGWLGSPFAMHLVDAGNVVSGTTRSPEKAKRLTQCGIETFLFDLYEQDASEIPSSAFDGADVLINLPPGRKNFSSESFVECMKSLIDIAVSNGAKHICFISTTSVFAGLSGRIGNDSVFSPRTASGKAHVEIELYLKDISKAKGLNTTVLRLAGLVGEDRHPITTLSKKSDIQVGKDPVNLVHQQDVIQAINAIFHTVQDKRSANFYAANLCSEEHPSREQYYTWCAAQKGLRSPTFTPDERETGTGKWIDAQETTTNLNLTLLYPSPYDMLSSNR
jgi:nucleoside-diphosphate-sugar epimerase